MFGINDNKNEPEDEAPVTPFPQGVLLPDSTPPPPPLQATPPKLSSISAPHNPAPAASVHSSGLMLPPTPSVPPTPPKISSPAGHAPSDDLLTIKQQALSSLAPLVDHLEQTPEEKFKTTMMLIQASDNAQLIPEAYKAANKISDDKVRAQALLDIVNEINYFTQHGIEVPEQKPA